MEVNGRLFNAYFVPAGACSAEEGGFWVTETPRCFPIIEVEKFYDGAASWEFSATKWHGNQSIRGKWSNGIFAGRLLRRESNI